MKTIHSKIILGSLVLTTIFACKKQESVEANPGYTNSYDHADSAAIISDSISSVATMKIKDKQFIKTAQVNMEVKDVYDTTIFIEKSVKNLGGFVTDSRLQSNIVSEESFNTSDKEAMLVKKFQTENSIAVRIPTANLGEFLQLVNDKKLFLNTRIISAEDVTSQIKYAELEAKRIKNTGKNIGQLKNNSEKVYLGNDNKSEENQQELVNMNMSDNLEYSTVDIYIKEPKVRVAEIAVTNTKNIDNKYKFNFFYDLKNAFVEGFYLIQKIIVGLVTIWPLVLIGAIAFYFLRKRKTSIKAFRNENQTT